ncbi:MAG: CAP domain-containing protein [Acidobacteria bacterium]|nr:MAG: CAP domain-containing protein [Acidobacteriota bacterium]
MMPEHLHRRAPAFHAMIWGTALLFLPLAVIGRPHSLPDERAGELLARRVLDAVNRERRQRGLRPLRWSDLLARAAQAHSQDMADRQFLGHINPDGYTPADRAMLAGARRFRWLAENVGVHWSGPHPAQSVVRGWMASPPHRANILNPRFRYTGVGVSISATGAVYVTEVFADRL